MVPVEFLVDGRMGREEWLESAEKKDGGEQMLIEDRTRKRFTYKMTKNK